jgi:hypothetical protein
MPEFTSSLTRRQAIAAAAAALLPASVSSAQSLPLNVMRYGREEPEAESLELIAGPLVLVFQPDIAFLRYVRLGDREILRGVYAAVRDRAWGTVTPRVSNIKVDRSKGAFDLTFDVDCREGDIDFHWKGAVRGSRDGTLRFSMDGLARSTFLRNRIGFCVLHPMRECAGEPCAVEQADGSVVNGRFPDLISPHQPFKNMRAITHEVIPGVKAEVRFEGDVFEMEDHRNWTDGNFKTYCTPLEKPFPVEVKKGTAISQAITLKLTGKAPATRRRASGTAPVQLRLSGSRQKLPAIGFGVDPSVELSTREIAVLRALRPAHLRVDIHLGETAWEARLQRAASISASLGAPLECALFVTDDADRQLAALAGAASKSKLRVARWLVFHENERSTSARLIAMAKKRLAGAPLGAGTNQYFTELNRERPPIERLDAVCYSINPQVHAFDNASLVENLEAQAHTVRTARSFARDPWLAITPVTLKPRFNPNASSPGKPAEGLPASVDVRQMSLFGAGWTLGSLKYLAEAGANSITYYELTGWAGLLERAQGSRLPGRFRSVPGGVFPLYHVFAEAAGFAGEVVPVSSTDPLHIDAMLLSGSDRSRLIVANLGAREQRVTTPEWLPARIRTRRLDGETYMRAANEPEKWRDGAQELARPAELVLAPYSLLVVDASGGISARG